MEILAFLREFKKRALEDRIFDLAAQLAYYFLMSLFPFLLLAVTLLGFLHVSSQKVLAVISPYAPPHTYDLIASNLADVLDKRRGGVLSISLVGTLYLATVAFRSVIRSLDSAYRVREDRSLWKEFVLGFFLMTGLLVALLVSLVLSVFGQHVGEFVFSLIGHDSWLWGPTRWLLSTLVLLFVFISLYKFAPNTRVLFRQALPGAVFATLGWQLISLGFSFYVRLNDYSLIYGNLGGIIVLVVWFYLTALILIAGGLINAVLCQMKATQQAGNKPLKRNGR
jgi:membrane protein